MFSIIVASVAFALSSLAMLFAAFVFLTPWGRNIIFEMRIKDLLRGEVTEYHVFNVKCLTIALIWVVSGIYLFG